MVKVFGNVHSSESGDCSMGQSIKQTATRGFRRKYDGDGIVVRVVVVVKENGLILSGKYGEELKALACSPQGKVVAYGVRELN